MFRKKFREVSRKFSLTFRSSVSFLLRPFNNNELVGLRLRSDDVSDVFVGAGSVADVTVGLEELVLDDDDEDVESVSLSLSVTS